jgi:hypothetical protein
MAMANKKPAKRAATKKTVKKAVKKESVAPVKAAPAQAARKKTPAMKSAVRVTKQDTRAVKPTSKSDLAQAALPFDSSQPETASLAHVPKKAAGAAQKPPERQPVSHDEIQHRAYLKWEAAGSPHGDGGHFWAEAERELSQQT